MLEEATAAAIQTAEGSGAGASPATSHIGEIDHLRGLAIALTVIAHLGLAMVEPPAMLNRIYSTFEFWGGVYLFFVVSGFVIARGFADALEDGAAQSGVWRSFYTRRFFRIVPLALAWILITLLVSVLANRHGSFGDFRSNAIQAVCAASFLYNACYYQWTPTFSVFWSLAFEEQFYLGFPLLCKINPKLRKWLLLVPIVALAFVHRPAGYFPVYVPFDALCWGVLIALWQRDGDLARFEPVFLRRRGVRWVIQGLLLLALITIPSALKDFTPATSIMTGVCALLVFFASFDRGYSMPPKSEWLRQLGLVSFSAYLCHMPAFLLGKEAALSIDASVLVQNLVAVTVGLSLTVCFTLASYRFIETPSRRFSRRSTAALVRSEARNL
jgi:peptidoglycan/LPS O-acetylase OafA/YrhL